jgi:hypothetical protein
MPLPKEEETPPVTKTYFVDDIGRIRIDNRDSKVGKKVGGWWKKVGGWW